MKIQLVVVVCFLLLGTSFFAQSHQIGAQVGTGVGNYVCPSKFDDIKTKENVDARLTYTYINSKNIVFGAGFGFFQYADKLKVGNYDNECGTFPIMKIIRDVSAISRWSAVSLPMCIGYLKNFKIKTNNLFIGANFELLSFYTLQNTIIQSKTHDDGRLNPSSGVEKTTSYGFYFIPKLNFQIGMNVSDKIAVFTAFNLGLNSYHVSDFQSKFKREDFLSNSVNIGFRFKIK